MRILILIIVLLQINILNLNGQEDINLNKIDLNDNHPNYEDFGAWVNDTLTNDGWKIEYHVKNDSTKYDDIYIRISKNNLIGVIKEKNVLNYRKYFIPVYEGENSENLFFTFASDTYTNGILIVNKKEPSKFLKKQTLLKYDIDKGYIFFIKSEGDYDQYEIGYLDAEMGIEKEIKFTGVCINPNKTDCVRNIIEGEEYIEFECHLKNKESLEYQIERQSIRLTEK